MVYLIIFSQDSITLLFRFRVLTGWIEDIVHFLWIEITKSAINSII